MICMNMHELFEELSAADPKWQQHYASLREAAVAADCLELYYDYLATADGQLRQLRLKDVPDTVRANKLERKQRERMLKHTHRNATKDYDGE
jgi:hypothetical protein